MDLAQTLIRMVARAFYDSKHVLVIDALMVHSALHNEDLALLLGMQQKDLRKLCGKLKEDRLLAVHSRAETREGQLRQINKDYYYIDFHATIDAIKYRIFHLTQKVKALYKPNEEKKDYFCSRCKNRYTQLDALQSISPQGNLLCTRCGFELDYDDTNLADSVGTERQSKLMAQLEPLLNLMKQIDSEVIPQNDFETAFSLAVPIPRNEDINPIRKTEPVDARAGSSTAVRGIAQVAAPIEVTLTTASERAAAERADALRKAELAAQNALPVWHTSSTVTGETTKIGIEERQRLAANAGGPALFNTIKAEEDTKEKDLNLDDHVAKYYELVKEENEQRAREDASSPEDEDDDEFEDVGIGAASGINTPSSSMSGAKAPYVNGTAQRIKVESESESSAPGTTFSTPAAFGVEAEERESPAKRRRLDTEAEAGESKLAEFVKVESADKDESDEDDVEFEDV